ncbi:MAG TPA: DJ-1/PfpI family protein [Myxococcales bacterium]|nr:DJ-1/PfpI family protein [Myxococcales bacterium]
MTTIGIVAFDDVEELDFAGPWEVFGMARKLRDQGDRLVLLAERDAPIRCAKLMRVLPDLTFAQAPRLDVLLVPGGAGTRREVKNPAMIEFLRAAGAQAQWVTSVCTGALLLHEAGFARGKRVTTHWAFVQSLRDRGGDVTVLENDRYVHDGNLVTAAGVSAGIDMALWLTGQLWGEDFARKVQKQIEYYPQPPFERTA